MSMINFVMENCSSILPGNYQENQKNNHTIKRVNDKYRKTLQYN